LYGTHSKTNTASIYNRNEMILLSNEKVVFFILLVQL